MRWVIALRAVYLIAIPLQLHWAVTADDWTRWVYLGCAALLGWVWWQIESSWRARARFHEALRWDIAASSDDPIRSLAHMDYIDRLSRQEVRELITWFRLVEEDPETAIAFVPPVVQGLYELGHAPREI